MYERNNLENILVSIACNVPVQKTSAFYFIGDVWFFKPVVKNWASLVFGTCVVTHCFCCLPVSVSSLSC